MYFLLNHINWFRFLMILFIVWQIFLYKLPGDETTKPAILLPIIPGVVALIMSFTL